MFLHQPSGLYLTLNRAYDPTTGRWLSRDPAGELANPRLNPYAYANDNPVNLVDPLGLISGGAIAAGAPPPSVPNPNLGHGKNSGCRASPPLDIIPMKAPFTCAGPNSDCQKINPKTKSPGVFKDLDNPGYRLCPSCFGKSFGRPGTGEDTE